MNMNSSRDQSCEQVREYLDRELPNGVSEQVSAHLSSCPECAQEQSNRKALQARMKAAASSVTVAPELEYRIRRSIRATPASGRWYGWRGGLMAAVATVTICFGGVIAYQLGNLRMTTASQEAYIRTISPKVAGIMRVGLGDHVHCAVFRKYPKNPPTVEKMIDDLGPKYKDLLNIVQKDVPSGYRVVLAHQCHYHGRPFVHLTVANGSRLVSLVIAHRGDGESFTRENLVPALIESGIPIYRQAVQKFDISGFETRDHLVYVVSNAGARQNSEVMTALAPKVREMLAKLES